MYLPLNWSASRMTLDFTLVWGDVTDCDNLQFDLGTVYDWASFNNMFFNTFFLTYVPFSINGAAYKSNAYIDTSMNIISPSTHVLDLGIFHVQQLYF